MIRSAAARLLGFVSIVVPSLGTDPRSHVLDVYPPWGQPMHDPGPKLLALSYRCIHGVLGSVIAARFAPYAPMRHALVLGVIGLPLSAAGMIAAIRMDLGPIWFPVALFLTVPPCAWLCGVLRRTGQTER